MIPSFDARALMARFLLIKPCNDPIMAGLFSEQLAVSLD
jgi:hypothetical protein